MNFVKFQWDIVLFPIAFSLTLNGCTRYVDESEFSKLNLSNESGTNYVVGAGYHSVRRGETLSSIARLYGLDYHDIAAGNGIYPPYTIFPNQQLLIYTMPVVNSGSSRFIPASYHPEFGSLSYKTVDVAPSNYSGYYVSPSNNRTPYVIPLNDRAIIPDYTSPATLPVVYNDDSYGFQSKSALSVVPTARISAMAIPNSNFHTVGKDENLESIAALYGLTIYDLAVWNGISDSYTVYPGQQLLIVDP